MKIEIASMLAGLVQSRFRSTPRSGLADRDGERAVLGQVEVLAVVGGMITRTPAGRNDQPERNQVGPEAERGPAARSGRS